MSQGYKIDLHTHSTASPDGGISPKQYAHLLSSGALDYIAITDHDHIDMAKQLHGEHGDAIIVGQEITTSEGELIGLFLSDRVMPGQTAKATAKAITKQGGLVYVPHPFETVRKGISLEALDSIAPLIDIVEVHNGRAVFQNKGPKAAVWARLHNKPGAASSDAHGIKGIGSSFTTIAQKPNQKNLATLLETARILTARPPLTSLLYPKLNRLRAKLKHKS
ncbi:PHP domain-containing protein [Candidatus Saccharibacteria bacterium]|nr:MAG: PHP domain-containing protein [Candidatus Saccharibacteria bacterium]